ncbi:MAG: hypothetical protein AB1649_23485 [Chloroflexota bacterium]
MLRKLSNKLQGWAKGWLVLIFMALDIAFVGFIMPIAAALMKGLAGGPGPLDMQFFSTPDRAYGMIEAYGKYTRAFYRNFELTVDIIYPIIYTLFFSLLITWLFRKGFAASSPMQKLNVIPFGAWLFDLLENIGIVSMISVYPSTPAALAWITTLFTMTKWLFVMAGMVLVLIGLVAAVLGLFRKREPAKIM